MLTSVGAGAITFRGGPSSCEAALTQIYAGRDGDQVEVDWEPWAEHLRELGYDESHVPHVMVEGAEDIDQILAEVRKVIGRPNWSWADGFTKSDSRRFQFYPEGLLPYEYLVHVAGFDVSAAIQGRLNHDAGLKTKEIRWLARRAPFWLPEAADAVEAIVDRMPGYTKVDAHRWLRRGLPAERREDLRRKALKFLVDAKSDADALFTVLDHVSVRDLSVADRRRLGTTYLRPDPATFDSGAIKTACYGLKTGGDCREMAFGHLSALLRREDLIHHKSMIKEKPVVVRVDGRVVGLVKTHGESSMLALVTVRDPDGYLQLVKGGVYRVSRTLWNLPARDITRRRWHFVDARELRVKPIEPVLNPQAWMFRNATILAILIGGDVVENMQMILHELVASGDYSDGDLGRLRTRYHLRVWTNILTRIDVLRGELERAAERIPRTAL